MLEIKNLKKSYDGITILHDMNLTIGDGEIVSILGPSGCGKTTLLNLILGLTDADGGEILFQGENVLNVPMEQRGFNIVFQDYALFPNLNVYKNFSLTESVAVVDKGDKSNPLAMEMTECIIKNGREELQQTYPLAIYEGETNDSENLSAYPMVFPEPLTVDLLEKHQQISENAKVLAEEL